MSTAQVSKNVPQLLPLTAAQSGLWFAQRIDPDNPSYTIAEYVDIRGQLDPVLLQQAVTHTEREIEALRLTFGERDGVPFQKVHEPGRLGIALVNLQGYERPEEEALLRMQRDLAQATDVTCGPLVSLTLYRLSADRHLFHQQVHHLAIDGYGAALVLARLAEVYSFLTSSARPTIPFTPAQLEPLLAEERAYEESTRAQDARFWAEYLTDAPPATGLTDAAAPVGHGTVVTGRTAAPLPTEPFKTVAKGAGVAWPTFFMAAMGIYLQRTRGLDEVVLGLPVTGRRTKTARSTPSMVSNIVPLRLRVSPSDTITDVVRNASAQAKLVLRHQRYPAEQLRSDQRLAGTTQRLAGPSVNVLAFDDSLRFGPAVATLHNLSIGPVEDLALAVHASFGNGGLGIELLGNPLLYDVDELAAHRARLGHLIEALGGDPERTVGSLKLLDHSEQSQVLALASGPAPAGETLTVSEEFALQAARTPAAVALVSGETRLSFTELDERVEALATALARRGAGPGTCVGVALPRSADLVTAMLAVLRTGAAYLPLDVSYPMDRLAWMIEDAHPVALVTTADTRKDVDPDSMIPFVTPSACSDTQDRAAGRLRRPGRHDAAYVIYTSGSTGRPKGVVVEHGSLANLLDHHRRELYTPAQRMLKRRLRVALTAATSFDASWDPMLWLVAGHELHIVEDAVRKDPEALVHHLEAQRIDVIETTPTYLRQMLQAGLLAATTHRPRVIALGGEPVDSRLWQDLAAHKDALFFNFYGPTETAVDSVTARITGVTRPVIGRPVTGASAYVLDSALHPMPQGVTGELYISGEGVARGYTGRPGLTAERFLPDPFSRPGARMYRTGDLARWKADGVLEFLGRSDRQVKIRGYRVETAEIEAVLSSLPAVSEVAVALVTRHDGPERLAAYLVVRPGCEVELLDLRQVLSSKLPEHMVPTAYAVVDRLPLTSNGKLDTERLPAAEPIGTSGTRPQTPEEERMCALFGGILGISAVGRDDDFFLLGGHSLLATQLISKIRAAFDVELPVRVLFEARTPAGLVAALAAAAPARPPVEALPRPERIPLSYAQQRLWLVDQMGDAAAAYHIPVALRLVGDLDPSALSAALTDVVRRHEALRTLIVEDANGARQHVLPPDTVDVPLSREDIQSAGGIQPDRSPFALERDLPLRAALFTAGARDHTLVLTLHHIAADGWSMAPLLHDLADAYAARLVGRAPKWDPLSVQYADYTLWQRELLGDAADADSLASRQLARFTSALKGLPAEATLPTDRPRPAHSSGRGGVVQVHVGVEAHRALVDLARSVDASTFMALHAALAALMTRLGAGEDIPVGTPVAGRSDEKLANLVGFFVNTLVLRADTSGTPTFPELIRRVRDADLAAYAHQDLPFDRLVEELAPDRRSTRHPLFQVMLSLNNVPTPIPVLPDLEVRHDPSVGRSGAKFDLTWDFVERHGTDGKPAGLSGELEYNEDLYDRSSVERFGEHFTRLLDALLADPELPFTHAEFLTPAQRAAALDHATDSGDSLQETVLDAFAAQTKRTPERTAVVATDARVTFAEVLQRARWIARLLKDKGVGRGERVAVALPRTSWAIAALLGVWQAGAVYVPLDPSHPEARNRMILDTAAPRLLLTAPGLDDALPATDHVLLLDCLHQPLTSRTDVLPGSPPPDAAAYVLYTSGSTGRPKGVVVEHRALANLLANHRSKLLGPSEAANNGRPLRVALTAALTFDASFDPLLWMVAGHELHLVDDATRGDAEALTAHLHEQGMDVVETTPSFLEQLRSAGLFAPGRARPRVVALGGEAVDEGLWKELADLRNVEVWNLYGPTEATVDSVMGRLLPGSRPHLGQSVVATSARVLDSHLQPAAPGAVAELYLSGPGLARGYDHRTRATAERFLPDPYGPPGSRMYRTGDLVRRKEGHLLYVGRTDGQIKVRGFRIETAEVTAVLSAHPDVLHAAAAVRPGPDGNGRLVAWIVPCDGREVTSGNLRTHLANRLPRYMVPSAVVPVAELALTVHGKVDFEALQDATPAENTRHSGPPRTAREEVLCALFADSLGHQTVGRDDDFFDLGGHSLTATRLVGRIRATFGIELPVRLLFEYSTPATLATRLDEAGTARRTLRPAARPDRPPLSSAQHRLWFLHRLNPCDTAYHIVVAVHLEGQLDRAALRAALGDVVARHESLRTLIKEHDGEPYQAVLDPGDARPKLPLAPVDQGSLDRTLSEAAARPFDLAHEPPLRAELFMSTPESHVLLVTVHHIAADGWSMSPLAQDLAGAYTARAAGRAPSWTQLPVQYADYSLWQRDLLGSTDTPDSVASSQLAYWKAQMADAPQETALPTDRPRPKTGGSRAGIVPFHLASATVKALTAVARASSASTFMVLHAAVTTLLHRLGGDDDITIGTPVAGRTDEALAGLIGFFVNTLALRTDLTGNPTFTQLLGRIRETDLSAYSHQELPFERLVEELQPPRSLSRHPLFQVMLSFNNNRTPQLDFPGLQARPTPVETDGAKFDLSFSFTEDDSDADERGLEGTLEFNRDLFDMDTAHRLAALLTTLLEQVTANPDRPLSELRLVDPAAETALIAIGDGGSAPTPPRTVLDHFAETVAAARSGDIAVIAHDGQLSFAELDERSGRIAALLAAAGVRRGETVAVLLPRSTDSLAVLLGVFKAGAVYAPLEPSLPDARITAVLDDAAPRLVIVDASSAARLPDTTAVLVLDNDTLPTTADTPRGTPPPAPGDLAYLIHTSGSTGKPKGVLVGHASLARLLEHQRTHLYGPTAQAAGRNRLNVALTASLSFDASLDPVLWMVAGHTLHIVDDLTRRDPEALVRAVRAAHLDVLESTPTHVSQLLDAGLLAPGEHRPRVLALGGEAVPPALWSRLRDAPETTSWNLYGPTEATVDTLMTTLAASERPVLGTPVTGTRAYLLDATLRPVPVGVTGDLYLAGDSLALGYIGRPGETARSFVPDPFRPGGGRMYRTGDRARRAADGALLFAGRGDTQVKIRGFRVEPDEVAAVLETCPTVARAVVATQDTGTGVQLAAYLVPADGSGEVPATGLAGVALQHAADMLPAYMVPAAWAVVDDIPLTSHGKLDRQALPEPAAAGHTDTGRSPRTPREELLCILFAEALGVEKVTIDDDFFVLGGHSLLATRLIGRVRAVLGVDVSIRTIFEAPTVAQLAARLTDSTEDDPLAILLPLRITGERPPLFCFHPATGLCWNYGGLLPYLDADQPVYGLQAPNLDGTSPMPDSLSGLAALYCSELRAVQPHGPYHLLGWSFGGNIVHEVAVQLQDAGEEVAFLSILDAFPVAPLDSLDKADRDTMFRALLTNLGMQGGILARPEPLRITHILEHLRTVGSPMGSLRPVTLEAVVDSFIAQARLMRSFTPRTFNGSAQFFTATEGRSDQLSVDLWSPYITGHIENHDVASSHALMFAPAARAQIGPTVAAALRSLHRTAQGDLS